MTTTYPYSTSAIRVEQPIGDVWLASLPADLLLDIIDPQQLSLASAQARGAKTWRDVGELSGTQRVLDPRRLKDIAQYINAADSSFPNSIILAFSDDGTGDTSASSASEHARATPWTISSTGPNHHTLTIPTGAMKARIVDGQHRLFSFQFSDPEVRKGFFLPCSIFLGLPENMQATLFAIINTTQKPVRRGMAMNLYGYNIRDEQEEQWAPLKLAVFMSRRLNFEETSPFFHSIKIEAANAPEARPLPGGRRPVPMAAITDGIVSLFSKDPAGDRDKLKQKTAFSKATRRALKDDGTPLRKLYLEGLDGKIFGLVRIYCEAFSGALLKGRGKDSMLTRSVGIRAIFDLLRDAIAAKGILALMGHEKWEAPVRASFDEMLAKTAHVDFKDDFFEASYRGRKRIYNSLMMTAGLRSLGEMPDDDRETYQRVLKL